MWVVSKKTYLQVVKERNIAVHDLVMAYEELERLRTRVQRQDITITKLREVAHASSGYDR